MEIGMAPQNPTACACNRVPCNYRPAPLFAAPTAGAIYRAPALSLARLTYVVCLGSTAKRRALANLRPKVEST